MRKILLLGFMLLSLFATAQETFEVNQITYAVTGESTVETNKYSGKDVNVTVPEQVQHNGKTYTVTAIGAESFSWTKVQSVEMPSTILAIKDKAFQFAEINKVTLPANLKTIGKSAYSSAKMEELEIPASVTEIGENAFLSCSKLKTIKFNEGLKTIGKGAFYHDALVTELVLPNTLEEIGGAAFSRCTALTNLTLPKSLVSIGEAAFLECANIKSLTLPDKLKSIGAEAFLRCTGITSLNIPASVEKLGDSFVSMTSINSITVDPNSEFFYVKDNNALYGKKQNVLYLVLMKGLTNLVVQDGTIGISGGACWGSEVQDVTLPSSLIAINDFAFFGTAISKINLPTSLTFIGEQAFAETKLTDIVIPENVTMLSKGVFAKCSELVSATLPSSVTIIDNLAFGFDSKLAKVVYLGSKVPEIVDYSEDYYSPFYQIADGAKLYVPKGCVQAFKDEHWNDFFTIVESDHSILQPVSFDPSDGTKVSGYKPMTFKIEFNEPVTVVNENPDVALRKKALFYPNSLPTDGSWVVTLNSDKKSVNVWNNDGDGGVNYYNFNEKIEYFVVIPSGIVRNAQGDMNERLVIKLVNTESDGIDASKLNKGNAPVVGYYNLNGQRNNGLVKGINIVKYADGTAKKIIVK